MSPLNAFRLAAFIGGCLFFAIVSRLFS